MPTGTSEPNGCRDARGYAVREAARIIDSDMSHSSVAGMRAAAASFAAVQQPRMPHLGIVQGNACVRGGRQEVPMLDLFKIKPADAPIVHSAELPGA